MNKITLTLRAQKDLEEIFDYIADENLEAALKVIEEIEEKIERLENFPESGRKVPELSNSSYAYREIIVRNYRIIYRYLGNFVYILTVRHGKRLLSKETLEK